MIVDKHIVISEERRYTRFPYPVQSVGYAFNNPRLKGLKYKFPDKVEFCIRTTSCGEPGSKAVMNLEGNEYELNYPHVLVKTPDSNYEYKYLDERDVFYFTYSKEFFSQLEKLDLFNGVLAWNVVLTTDINRQLGQLRDYLEKSSLSGTADRIDLLCFQLMSEFLIQKNSQSIDTDPEKELILRIDSYFRIHYMEDINIDGLALKYGMSRTSFFRKWAKYFQESPAKQLLQLRLREASRQLLETQYRISEIAQRVNIPDPAYFGAVFRKHFGVSPAAFRAKNTGNIPE